MKKIKNFIFIAALALLLGIICGGIGSFFSKSVEIVTNIRTQNNYILYLLPIGGVILVLIYKLCRVKNVGTTNVFDCVRTEKDLPPFLAVAVFCGSCISHLFGASIGREGAALQIGGGVANVFAKFLKLNEDSRHILVMCGMAALFSAVFGTPLAACVFVLEVILTKLCFLAAIPVLISSSSAYIISTHLHIHHEKFNIGHLPNPSFSLVLKILLITVACILAAFIFCAGLNFGKTFAKKIFKNEFLRIALGGVLIVLLTLLINTRDYNGGGIDIIENVFTGSVKYEAFAFKMLFTVICVSCGYKGGEIIPTLFIGATLGGALALILSIPVATGAVVGMAVLFVCATKCPAATILLCGEMFGFYSLILIAPIVIISFVAARYKGLYSNNKDIIKLICKNKKV